MACADAPPASNQAAPAPPAAGVPAGPGLEILEPRAQVLPNAMGTAYFTVRNSSQEGDRLLRVESAAANVVETHESIDEDGVIRMVPRPEGFEIPAGSSVALEPGGKHVMLMEIELEEGAESMGLTLHFERAGAVEVEAALLQGTGGMDHGEMDHGEMDH